MDKIKRKTHKIDASGQSLGRLSSEIANLLRGKNKPEFQPHLDMGDIVEVTNIDKIKNSAKKMEQKKYFSHSGYPGNLKEKTMAEVFAKDPGEVLRRAIREMLPPTKHRKEIMKRLIIK